MHGVLIKSAWRHLLMLVHNITVYKPPITARKKERAVKGLNGVEPGSEDHKVTIYERTFIKFVSSRSSPKEGDYITLRGAKRLVVQLVWISTEFDKVEWEGLKCKFLEVMDPVSSEF